tara:strand:- start:133 stop:264 length:132 start_codon:yes stop_codon:yes gene_type:complete
MNYTPEITSVDYLNKFLNTVNFSLINQKDTNTNNTIMTFEKQL